MAERSPQVEDGYTRIADEFLEALIHADYPASVLRFMLIVVRETWGWQRKEAAIPTKRFAEVFRVTERRVRQIRDDCLRHNLIEVEPGEQFETPIYRIQKRYLDWLTWKTNNPWEGPPTRKTNIPSFPEDEHTEYSEDEPSDPIKGRESLKEKEREDDTAATAVNDAKDILTELLGPEQGGAIEAAVMAACRVHPDAKQVLVQECGALAARQAEGEKVSLRYLANNVRDAAERWREEDALCDDLDRLHTRLVGPRPRNTHWSAEEKYDRSLREFREDRELWLYRKCGSGDNQQVRERAEELGVWDDGLVERVREKIIAGEYES